jgi:hypothetical protein
VLLHIRLLYLHVFLLLLLLLWRILLLYFKAAGLRELLLLLLWWHGVHFHANNITQVPTQGLLLLLLLLQLICPLLHLQLLYRLLLHLQRQLHVPKPAQLHATSCR